MSLQLICLSPTVGWRMRTKCKWFIENYEFSCVGAHDRSEKCGHQIEKLLYLQKQI